MRPEPSSWSSAPWRRLAEVAERLRLDPGDQAVIRRRRMFADDEPMQLATCYVPWPLAEGTQMTTEHTGPDGCPGPSPTATVLCL